MMSSVTAYLGITGFLADAGRRESARSVAGGGRLMEEGMIQAQATAERIACARMTMLHLTQSPGSQAIAGKATT
jgi:hypothetical protein